MLRKFYGTDHCTDCLGRGFPILSHARSYDHCCSCRTGFWNVLRGVAESRVCAYLGTFQVVIKSLTSSANNLLIDYRHRIGLCHHRHVLSDPVLPPDQPRHQATSAIFEDPVDQARHFPIILAVGMSLLFRIIR